MQIINVLGRPVVVGEKNSAWSVVNDISRIATQLPWLSRTGCLSPAVRSDILNDDNEDSSHYWISHYWINNEL